MTARFIPNVAPDDIAHDSERLVLQALAHLPAQYVVLHSFPWLRPLRDLSSEPLREGEADFVVLHPERGLLVVEVKGGTPELRGRRWHRAGHEIRDPFEQARRNRYALLGAVEQRTQRRLHRGLFTHGDAVIFPHAMYDGPLPLNADARTFVDARGLADLPDRIESTFAAWARQPTYLSAVQFDHLLDALMPTLRLMRCVGAELAAETTRIVQVTEDQHATLQGLLASDRVLVEGIAGSGKTLLALEFAVSMAADGQTVLFLCFNRHLATWLQEQVAAEPRLRGRQAALEIGTFHAFALRIARRAGVQFKVPTTASAQFWDDEVPLILEQALDILRQRGSAQLYDAVVVDEAQDFSRDWWVTVESLTRGRRDGKLYVFVDLHQSLRGETRLPPVPLPTKFKLTTNCRNTRLIASSSARFGSVEVRLLRGSPQGELPSLRRARAGQATPGLVLQELRTLLQSNVSPRQLVVIGAASHENGTLARFHEIDGLPFVSDAAAWRRGEGILVTTARAFKGLEAEVVLVYDVAAFTDGFNRADLYVAWTRARHRLLIYCHGTEARDAIERALAETELASVQN